jgi:hypothetical protein
MNMTNISLKDVRIAAENLAHKLVIPIEEISVNNILEHMGRGSKGTIAAHLREVKIEKAQAEKCDLYDLTIEFNSSLANLIETRVQKAEQAILQESKITTEAFLTFQTENENLTAGLKTLKAEFRQFERNICDGHSRLGAGSSHCKGRVVGCRRPQPDRPEIQRSIGTFSGSG